MRVSASGVISVIHISVDVLHVFGEWENEKCMANARAYNRGYTTAAPHSTEKQRAETRKNTNCVTMTNINS